MAETDTSSYLKPTAQKSLFEQATQIGEAQQKAALMPGQLQQQQQQLESGALTIDKQKLDLVNQRFGEMAKGFTGLLAKPDLSAQDVDSYADNQVKLGYITPEMAAQIKTQLPRDAGTAAIKQKLGQDLAHAQTTVEAINYHFGTPASQTDNANTYNGVQLPANQGGGFKPATQTPLQLPPTTPTIIDNKNTPGYVGPSGPAGPRPLRANVAPPVATPAIAQPPKTTGPIGPTVETTPNIPTDFSNRFQTMQPPAKVASAPAPGVAAAQGEVAAQSGKDYATDLTRTKNFQADLYPAQQALDIVKSEGPKAFGPGTEGLNAVKSAIVTWLPNVDQKTVDGVSNFEQARKYLTQIARSSGATGTNDQLAAAFEANPSVKMSGAAIENVLKSVIALRKMQHAQTLLFGEQNLPPDEYSKWISKNQNVLDPRAFGFDIMTPEAKKALITKLGKDPAAYKKFEDSLSFANKAGLIEPPAAK